MSPAAIGIGQTAEDSGAVAAPGAAADIASIAAPGAGDYEISVISYEVGTVDANRTNMQLMAGSRVIGDLLSTGVASPQEFPNVHVNAAEAIHVQSIGAAGAGSVYVASIAATRVA